MSCAHRKTQNTTQDTKKKHTRLYQKSRNKSKASTFSIGTLKKTINHNNPICVRPRRQQQTGYRPVHDMISGLHAFRRTTNNNTSSETLVMYRYCNTGGTPETTKHMIHRNAAEYHVHLLQRTTSKKSNFACPCINQEDELY